MSNAGCVSLHLPLGMTLGGSASATPGLNFDPMRGLLVNLNGALAPMMPIFKIVGFAKDVLDTLESIPNCITQLNPQPLISKLEKVTQDIDQLLECLPQLAVPVMLRDLIGALLTYLYGIQGQLRGLLGPANTANALAQLAAPLQQTNPAAYAELNGIVQATLTDGAGYIDALDAQSCAFNSLASAITNVAALIGAPVPPLLPCFNFSGGSMPPTAYISALNAAIDAITVAIDVLTALGAALGGATAPVAPC
jgi:hypothetical protein